MLKIIALTAAVCLPTSSLAGAFLSGNDLHKECQTNRAKALWYILGVTDYEINNTFGWSKDKTQVDLHKFVCLPDTVEAQQIFDIACGFLKNNPSSRHQAAYGLVTASLVKAFPCS